ncbi:hypothetical protein DYJ42_00185 [Streptococcus constellatus]|uniref:beta family protein n=1 Tax=Streptococcus constellatus TaxID=76860 RepID=UPI000E5A159F|nr:hypothetical protein [Streptococcus constellatus]RID95137.1 hypothetical protein DYJ42_00185 [Streptococcus constellatus]
MYIINLNPKQSERRAVSHLTGLSETDFLPNFILSNEVKKYQQEISSIIQDYKLKFLVDTKNFSKNELPDLIQYINSVSSNISLVYNLDNLSNNTAVSDFLKISLTELNPIVSNWLVSDSQDIPQNIIFDFGYISKMPTIEDINKVSGAIRRLNTKNIIISSGAVPDVVPVKREENYSLQRYEKLLFNELQTLTHKKLIYSDYGTIHPLPMGKGFTATVQIKYTTSDNYIFVRNGQFRGNYKLFPVANEICKHPIFDENHCWGEQLIQEIHVTGNNQGNPSIWVSIGLNHHIQLCIDETR